MKPLQKILIIVVFFYWINLSAQSNEKIDLNVMSFNIQQGTHYTFGVTPSAVAKIVHNHNIDLVGTQEQHIDGVNSLIKYLPEYGWFGVGRDNGGNLGETCVVLFKKNRFELIEHNTFWLSETPEIPGSKSWNTDNTRIVTWGKLKIKNTDKLIFIFNTHFDHVSALAREESAKLLLKKIREIAKINPVVVTGDFNCWDYSKPYKILTENYPDHLQFRDAYKNPLNGNKGPSGTYNGYFTNNPSSKIDFVFVNDFFEVYSNEVITDKREDGKFISDHFPIKSVLKVKFPNRPVTPILKAVAGDNKVMLTWDSNAETKTLDTFLEPINDFQGYKLYKSKTPDMKDALLMEDKWNVPLLRIPLFECDKIDSISGYTDFGIIDGFGYYLGNNSGLQHIFVDNDVENGQTYYYVLLSYDNGIPNFASGIAPMESELKLQVDNNGEIINSTSNVAKVTPQKIISGTPHAGVKILTDSTFGNGIYNINIIDPDKVIKRNYRVEFIVDTINLNAQYNKKYRSERDIYYVNSGFKIISEDTENIIYQETIENYTGSNIQFNPLKNYYFLNNKKKVETEEFEGIQLQLNNLVESAFWDTLNSGWKNGDYNIEIKPSIIQSKFFPYNYEIKFGQKYKSKLSSYKGVRDADNQPIGNRYLILKKEFDFKVVNTSFNNEELDIVGIDSNEDEVFDPLKDKMLVGYSKLIGNKYYWSGTLFEISFANVNGNLPGEGDVYKIVFKRPFSENDKIRFEVDPQMVGIEKDRNILHEDFELYQNYPNPFNPNTNISFSIPKAQNVKLEIYNSLGQKVLELLNQEMNAGLHKLNFDGSNLSSGIYFYTLKCKDFIRTKKMILLK